MPERIEITRYTGSDAENIRRLRQALAEADAVVIGAGAGLSTAAGFTYSGERFRKWFSRQEEAYGYHDMYSGGFYQYATPEEEWAFWWRNIYVNRYLDPPKPTYRELEALTAGKDRFVITTNVDHCFQKAGFEKERLFYTQGDYGLWQCSLPCHQATYDNEAQVREMMAADEGLTVPTRLIPRCPKCGRPMMMNLRGDDRFVEDAGWDAAAGRFDDFLRAHQTGKVLYWELGVGFNTPGIIKYPFWRMTMANPEALYACVNLEDALCPKTIADRSICIDRDVNEMLALLRA